MDGSLSIDELGSVPSFTWPAVSPSGASLAVYREQNGQCMLLVIDLDTGTTTSVQSELALKPNHRIVWDRAGEQLYVHHSATGEERTDIYTLGIDGTAQSLITREGRCWLWDVSPDDRSFLYSHRRPDADLWKSPRTLYRYDRDADTHHQLTPDDQFVMARGNRYNSDGEWLTYAAATKGDGSLLERSRVYIARTDGTDAQALSIGGEESRTLVKDWHPADRQLLVYDTATTTRCGVYDIQTETLTWFGTGAIQEKPVVWLPDGVRFLAIRKAHTTTIPIVYDCRTEQARELAVDGSCSYAPTATDELVIDAQHVLVPRSTPTVPMEVLSYDLQTDTTTTLFRTSNGAVEPSQLVDPEYISYESTDGRSIGTLLYRTSEQPSPAIVLVHGGRHGRASEDYHWPSQFLVDRGFTVLRPNYRGSSGRGRAFKQLQYGDLGGHDAMDVAAGGQWLRRQDWIESDRVAVYGRSYGGYLTYLQMVRYPKVWAVGIAAAGLTDLVAIYDSNPDLPGLHEMGNPESNTALLRERSPIVHVDQFEGPLLMLHGAKDMTSPVSHARRFREALIEHGCEEGYDFEYHEYEDHGHAFVEREHIQRHWRAVDSFLNRL